MLSLGKRLRQKERTHAVMCYASVLQPAPVLPIVTSTFTNGWITSLSYVDLRKRYD